ncbi:MAG: DNA polymerase/3'-5' exonuclease PolX [Saprospiraceae bacterium]|nr:DNA polymerase/3'-5' exonuclease PolX [Saprospiraceae bacterium]
MDNTTIAKKFDLLAKLMELYDENPFRIKSYSQAYVILRKVEKTFASMSLQEIDAIPGVGSGISGKIKELLETGNMKALDVYLNKTPPGILDMLAIRGFGPKKVKQIWKTLEIETIGELIYACNENRIANLKGFGLKTQQELIENLQYAQESKDKWLYSKAFILASELIERLFTLYPLERFQISGELSLQLPIIQKINITATIIPGMEHYENLNITLIAGQFLCSDIPVFFNVVQKEQFVFQNFILGCSEKFSASFNSDSKIYSGEEEIFSALGFPYVHPPRRDNTVFLQKNEFIFPPIERKQCKGTFHHHTTYSDGIHTLREMQKKATLLAYDYIVVSDHSQSAFYANGLKMERVEAQWQEIDQINSEKSGSFMIKGIESDILNDGALDYPDHFLTGFECVIASIHSNLKMDEEKATHRLIKAIENPFTRILGHPTGRLLLSRQGYPVDMEKVIDACSANGVAIELNANPRRLDIDYTWLDYVAKKNVLLSINPDAHSADAIEHIIFGIKVVQKINFNPENILNTWEHDKVLKWLDSK